MDDDEVRSAFIDRGVVRFDAAFTGDEAARIREAVWRHAERKAGIQRDDPSTWRTGWLNLSWKPLRRHSAFNALINSPAVTRGLQAIFGPGGWQPPKPGAQVLFTLPTDEPWTLPRSWHMDCGFEQPTWPVFAVKLFAFFGDVGPCGGGTLLLPGTHRLVDRYRDRFETPPAGGNTNWHAFLRRHPPLGELLEAAGRPDGGRSFVGRRLDVDGVPVDVVELTGAPGDVVMTHLHVFHAISPNTAGSPRQMLGKAVMAAPPAPRAPVMDAEGARATAVR